MASKSASFGEEDHEPHAIQGNLYKDRKGWADLDYQRLDGEWIGKWASARIYDLPEGALVRISIEVLDPHPED